MRSTAAADSNVSALAMKAMAMAVVMTVGLSNCAISPASGGVIADRIDSGTTTRATGRLSAKATSVASTTPTSAPGTSFIEAGRNFSQPSMPRMVTRPTAKAVAAS